MEFIASHLPPAPARVLDAGCGDGELADQLRGDGYDVTAIDIDPALERPGVRVADICTYQDDPFDAIVMSQSLHHVHDLDMALDRTAALLQPSGRLIIDEFAYERADASIADRFYAAAGSLEGWREDHGDLHTGATMIDAIRQRFAVGSLAQVPYLYRYLEDDSLRDTESVLGIQLTATRKDTTMAVVRTTRYTVEQGKLDELLTRRAALIDRIRADHPSLTDARLVRLEDGTYADAWRWSSPEEMQRALATAPTLPEAQGAFDLALNATADNAEVVDER